MGNRDDFDFVAIGGGTAGLVASRTAAGFGARTALIEGNRLGGDCLWTGCVPSKSLIAAAAAFSRSTPSVGVPPRPGPVDFETVMAHVHAAMDEIAPIDSSEALAADGVEVIRGTARFTSPRTLDVAGRRISFGQAIIATGGSPTVPPLHGAEGIDFLTSESVWDLTELPARMLVLGGGAIGCELAQAFARLGSHVTIIARGPRLLPKEEARASAVIRSAMEADGVDVRTSRTITSVTGRGRSGTAILDDGSIVAFDAILAATGRRPNTSSLEVERAGVRLDEEKRVIVNSKLRTSNPRIWAAGDVTPLPQFTHTAGVNGSLAASNAILGLSRTVDTVAVPRVTFTHPEVGAVGLPAGTPGLITRTVEHSHLDRAIAEGETNGYTQLVVDRRGRIRGVTIVGPRAGETLGEASLAVKNGLTTSDIAGTTHAYPTFGDAFWTASVADVRARLRAGATGAAVGALAGLRALWLR